MDAEPDFWPIRIRTQETKFDPDLDKTRIRETLNQSDNDIRLGKTTTYILRVKWERAF